MELYIRVSLNVANAFQRLCDHRLNSLKQDMFLPHSLVFHDFPGVEAVKRRCPNTMSSSCIFGGVHLQFPHWVFPALRQPSNLVYSSVTEGLVVNCWAAHSDMMHQVQKLDWIFGPVYAVTLITCYRIQRFHRLISFNFAWRNVPIGGALWQVVLLARKEIGGVCWSDLGTLHRCIPCICSAKLFVRSPHAQLDMALPPSKRGPHQAWHQVHARLLSDPR